MTHPSDPSPPGETEDLKARIAGLEALLCDAQEEIGELKGCTAAVREEPMIELTQEETEAMRGLNLAMDIAHRTANEAGWYRDPRTGEPVERNFGEVLALMHSELSEALEAHRKNLMDDKLPHRHGIEVELADCLIRIFDTARALKLDVAGAVIEKNRFNVTRADHKLAARAAGGKRY